MRQQQPEALSASNLGEYARHEVPDDLDLWPSVKARVEAAKRRPAPPWRLGVHRTRWLVAVSAVLMLVAAGAVAYVVYSGDEVEAPPQVAKQLEVPSLVEKELEPPVEATKAVVAPSGKKTEATAEPPHLLVSTGPQGSPRTIWVVDLSQSTMARWPGLGRELEPVKVGTGLDLVGLALTEDAEAPLAGVYVHGNYAFIGGQNEGYWEPYIKTGVRILDVSNPASPQLVGRIPLRSEHKSDPHDPHSHGDAIATHIESDAFQGDVAIVINGVADTFTVDDYPMPFGIWDVTDPSEPQFLSALNLGQFAWIHQIGDLGDKPMDAKAVNGRYFYALYKAGAETHMAVVDLADPRNPQVVGEWSPTDRNWWLKGLSINQTGTRAYVVGIPPPHSPPVPTVLYILDLRDPEEPVEIGRHETDYKGPTYSPYAVPNDDDTLVILADGRWGGPPGCGGHGKLHILDISNLNAIRELSSVQIEESDACFDLVTERHDSTAEHFYQATDMAVKGNLIYSTWLKGGLHVTDISDPVDPVEVGEFRAPSKEGPWLSDVALYGDYALTTTVWGSGMYILRLQ